MNSVTLFAAGRVFHAASSLQVQVSSHQGSNSNAAVQQHQQGHPALSCHPEPEPSPQALSIAGVCRISYRLVLNPSLLPCEFSPLRLNSIIEQSQSLESRVALQGEIITSALLWVTWTMMLQVKVNPGLCGFSQTPPA